MVPPLLQGGLGMQSGAPEEVSLGLAGQALGHSSTGSFCSPPLGQKERRLFLRLPL